MLKAMLRAVVSALAVSLLVTGCARSVVRFPNATPETPRTVPGRLARPAGAGPFPAVVLLHGCHGVSASTHDWARWFRDQGYVALVVDSWAARGIAESCSPQSVEPPNTERFDDTVGALRFLHTLPYVDRQRVGVIGWSNGGVFAMAVVNGPSHERARRRGVTLPEPGFRAAVGVYPGGCHSLVGERAVQPLLLLMGDADDWTSPGPCREMVEAMRGRGADVTIVLYPGAFHYFDVEGQPRTYLADVANRNKPGECCGATVAYDDRAAADARRRVAEFFGYHLSAR
ncbi:MAG: dienelactone hydrolase family protein [Candidatus Rokuibacteriota bacterium]